MTDPLTQHIAELQRRLPGVTTEPKPDGSQVVTIPAFPLPAGWNRESALVRFVVPVGFPIASPDSFWSEPDLRLQSGAMPMNTALQQPWPNDGPFLWFSWHPTMWNPQRDSLASYVGIIAKRLSEAR